MKEGKQKEKEENEEKEEEKEEEKVLCAGGIDVCREGERKC